jgi:2Fe-2S ferredoxin
MAILTFIQEAGERVAAEVEPGVTVMEAAVRNNVPGIIAECGGSCSCATCHVYVEDQWIDRLEEPAPEESELLEYLEGGQQNSRLACQIIVGEALDGIVLRVPGE